MAAESDFIKGKTKTIYALVITNKENRDLERRYLGYYEDQADAQEAYLEYVNYTEETAQWQPSVIDLKLHCRSH